MPAHADAAARLSQTSNVFFNLSLIFVYIIFVKFNSGNNWCTQFTNTLNSSELYQDYRFTNPDFILLEILCSTQDAGVNTILSRIQCRKRRKRELEFMLG